MAEITPREFVDIELKLIGKVFDQTHVMHPMFVVIKDDKRHVIPAAFKDDIQKEIVSQGIKDLVKYAKPDIVIYAAEAWALIDIQEYKEGVTPRPMDHPSRQEVIVTQIEFRTGEKFHCMARIIRQGGSPHLDKFDITSGNMSMGRFTDFFPITRTN